MNKSIGIIGGGILGMTLALRLRQRGFQVTIFESSKHPGGLAGSMEIGGYCWDRFYHVILMSDINLLGLLGELGIEDEIQWNQTETGFFTDGRFYSMSNLKEFLQFPPLRMIDKLRLGATIFYASRIKQWKRLEAVSVSEWLRKLSGERTYGKIWQPLLKSKLGNEFESASAAFIWAIIARMYAARRSGLKQEMFGYAAGGYQNIIGRFEQRLIVEGVQIEKSSSVTKILADSNGVEIHAAENGKADFNGAILTCPGTEIPGLCPQLSGQEKKRLESIQYQGVICAALLLKNPLAGYYITNITEDWVPFTAVIEMTALVDRSNFDGHSLVYLPLYLNNASGWWEKTDAEIREQFVAALEKMYPSFSNQDVMACEISRAKFVLPIPTMNYSNELLPDTRTSIRNVFVVNSAQVPDGTMNVNELVGLGNRKAAELANALFPAARS